MLPNDTPTRPDPTRHPGPARPVAWPRPRKPRAVACPAWAGWVAALLVLALGALAIVGPNRAPAARPAYHVDCPDMVQPPADLGAPDPHDPATWPVL